MNPHVSTMRGLESGEKPPSPIAQAPRELESSQHRRKEAEFAEHYKKIAALIEPALERSNTPETALRHVETSHEGTIKRDPEDPHGLGIGTPLAFAAYTVATECYSKLLNGTIGEEAVLHRLRKLVPKSAFQIDYVTRQAFKFINPRGHGANSASFNNETLAWFRQTYPADSHLTAGLILVVCAAKWWTHEQGRRSVIPRVNPLMTSDLDSKLKSFGFLSGEREAICRMLRRDSSQR